MPVWEAASISTTSTCRLSMIAWQCSPKSGQVDGRAGLLAGLGVVQRPGDDAGRGGLADAAHARQHIGLRDPAALEGVPQRAHHRILADQIVEGLRAVFAREDEIGLCFGCHGLCRSAALRARLGRNGTGVCEFIGPHAWRSPASGVRAETLSGPPGMRNSSRLDQEPHCEGTRLAGCSIETDLASKSLNVRRNRYYRGLPTWAAF